MALDSNISGLYRPRTHSSIARSLGMVHLLECLLHGGRTRHHRGEQDMGCSITTILQAQQATLLSLSSAPLPPGKPRCHLLSHHTQRVAVPTPGQSERGCRFEPSLSCHVGWAGQKKPKLGKSSNLAHKSPCGS